jgi:hypothetical protein
MPWVVNWCGWRGATGASVEGVGLSMNALSWLDLLIAACVIRVMAAKKTIKQTIKG